MLVEIEEDFEQYSNKKENVYFENTGLASVKVRATIVGYWVSRTTEGEEIIIADWNESADGVFVGLPGKNWEKKADGFYYYNSTVPSKGKTTNLFTSYTLNENPPVAGAELVLTIVCQASFTN